MHIGSGVLIVVAPRNTWTQVQHMHPSLIKKTQWSLVSVSNQHSSMYSYIDSYAGV